MLLTEKLNQLLPLPVYPIENAPRRGGRRNIKLLRHKGLQLEQ
jgi:hypothetical protein